MSRRSTRQPAADYLRAGVRPPRRSPPRYRSLLALRRIAVHLQRRSVLAADAAGRAVAPTPSKKVRGPSPLPLMLARLDSCRRAAVVAEPRLPLPPVRLPRVQPRFLRRRCQKQSLFGAVGCATRQLLIRRAARRRVPLLGRMMAVRARRQRRRLSRQAVGAVAVAVPPPPPPLPPSPFPQPSPPPPPLPRAPAALRLQSWTVVSMRTWQSMTVGPPLPTPLQPQPLQ